MAALPLEMPWLIHYNTAAHPGISEALSPEALQFLSPGILEETGIYFPIWKPGVH